MKSKTYEPAGVESTWTQRWETTQAFKAPTPQPGQDTYTVMMPPPNVTGILHLGHILNNTIQDILCRRARQSGKAVLWLPGTDHAGIATQTKVVQALKKEGLTKEALGRDAFLERANQWRDQHRNIILGQLKAIGASSDSSRIVHTLDEDYSHAVLTAFVKLFNDGYIYRGKRMINYCPVGKTALSDEEVIMQSTKRSIYKLRYELVDTPDQFIEICTTRPETIMGDTAVAVNPNDERYQHLIGKHVYRPYPKAPIPIIGEDAVEIEFGTGALKVTPAHDPLDFEIGQRHNLPIRDTFDDDLILNELAEQFQGLSREDARKAVIQFLEDNDHLIETEDYESPVGISERGQVPVEPKISEQWFLKYPKVEEALQVVEDGKIRFWPNRWTKTYTHWLSGIQDWCISRQLWWGHRIPVWYKKGADRKDTANWHVSVEGPSDPEHWEQDEDVLDTWASSWLWPFATLGWPNDEQMTQKQLSAFYPTSTLVTGPDIIFFWVARMIMAGLEFIDGDLDARIPFKDVYFTGIIRDDKGRKMSKSLGNSPDPLDLIEKYGADGLRFAIINIAPQGQDILFSEERVTQGRNFCNKLWNACRFRQMSGELKPNDSVEAITSRIHADQLNADDHFILNRLIELTETIEQKYEQFDFNGITQTLYSFFWTDYCYLTLEVTKLRTESEKPHALAIQDLIMRQLLALLHPFIPFITEELWEQLGYSTNQELVMNTALLNGSALREALQGQGIEIKANQASQVSAIRETVSQGRALKAQFQLSSSKDVKFKLKADPQWESMVQNNHAYLVQLLKCDDCELISLEAKLPGMVTPLGVLYLDIADTVDLGAERTRLEKEKAKLEKVLTGARARLKDEKFLSNAPDKVIEGAKKNLADTEAKYEEVKKLYEVVAIA